MINNTKKRDKHIHNTIVKHGIREPSKEPKPFLSKMHPQAKPVREKRN